MGRHRKMRVEPSAKVTSYFNRLNINSANTDRTVMNFQQLLSRSDKKKPLPEKNLCSQGSIVCGWYWRLNINQKTIQQITSSGYHKLCSRRLRNKLFRTSVWYRKKNPLRRMENHSQNVWGSLSSERRFFNKNPPILLISTCLKYNFSETPEIH